MPGPLVWVHIHYYYKRLWTFIRGYMVLVCCTVKEVCNSIIIQGIGGGNRKLAFD